MLKQEEFNKVVREVRLRVINNIPGYTNGTKNRNKREIQELLSRYDYDMEDVESVNEDFCYGWNAAKDVIVQVLSEMLNSDTL